MTYSVYELIWFYFLYSFLGWCVEVSAAAIRHRRFINRGFVMGPLCPIFGAGAVLFSVFLPELKEQPVFLFLGGAILSAFIELMTASALEKLFHRKWWDYSGEKIHFEGYICLKYSLIWGACAVVILYFTNGLFTRLLQFIPHFIGVAAVWVLAGILFLDFLGTALALLGMQKKMHSAVLVAQEMERASWLLENAIIKGIEKHVLKAFPKIGEMEAAIPEKEPVFAKGCGFYKLTGLFFIGAFLGDITETIFCLITTGTLMSRSSVIYGPFSIVWGLACALLTAVLYRYREKNDRHIFFAGVVLGGAYEYICSVFTELVFGTVFWDYSEFAFNLGGRINLLYCFFWGIAAVVWLKAIYPRLSGYIEKIPVKAGKIIFNLLIVFMICNMVISGLALARYTERNSASVQEENAVTAFLDRQYPDERMEKVYPNVKIVQ